MTAPPGWLGSLSIRTQIVALVMLAQVAAHAVTLTILLAGTDGETRKAQLRESLIDGFATALAVLDPAVTSQAPAIATLVARDPRFALRDALPDVPHPTDGAAALPETLPAAWRGRVEMRTDPGLDWPGPVMEPFALGAQLGDGAWLWFRPEPNVMARTLPLLVGGLTLLAAALPIALLTVWAGAAVVAPVARLGDGARRFARDVHAPPLELDGPKEVRAATEAFNAMQARMRVFMDGRATTLASIGHDMRTPLTRLRLRLDTADLGPAREGVERDLEILARMIDEGLRFMRSETRPLEIETVDLSDLVSKAGEEARLDGASVTLDVTSQALAACDRDLTRRAIDALIDNALRYAGAVEIAVRPGKVGAGPTIRIADRGPGIPEADHAAVLRPFHRLDAVARGGPSQATGFGIGLATATEVMARQGGTLRLGQTKPNGLTVTLAFDDAI